MFLPLSHQQWIFGLKSIRPMTVLEYTGIDIGLLAMALTGWVRYRMSLRTTLFQIFETRMRLAALGTFERMRQSSSLVAKAAARAGCLSVWSPRVAFSNVSDKVWTVKACDSSISKGWCSSSASSCVYLVVAMLLCTMVTSRGGSDIQWRCRIGKD